MISAQRQPLRLFLEAPYDHKVQIGCNHHLLVRIYIAFPSTGSRHELEPSGYHSQTDKEDGGPFY